MGAYDELTPDQKADVDYQLSGQRAIDNARARNPAGTPYWMSSTPAPQPSDVVPQSSAANDVSWFWSSWLANAFFHTDTLHSAVESLPAIPQEFLADELAQKGGSSPAAPDESGVSDVVALDQRTKRRNWYGREATSDPIQTANPSDILMGSGLEQIRRSAIPRPQRAQYPEELSPFGPGYAGRKRP